MPEVDKDQEKPRTSLVVGVGGAGKGALNWLKESLIREYGDMSNCSIELFAIDGPQEDHYEIQYGPGLDKSEHSDEFHQVTHSPEEVINEFASGRSYPPFDTWLTKELANALSSVTITPESGFGGQRVAARVCFFLEVSDGELATHIQGAINRARSKAKGKSSAIDIYVVGSQAGGVGSGMLLDVAALLRAYSKTKDRLIGILLLPSGFDAVFKNDTGEKKDRNARAFAGLREYIRMLGTSMEKPVQIEYTGDLDVNITRLFNMCFVIDGTSRKVDLSDIPPVYSITPVASDFVYTLLKGGELTQANFSNWEPQKFADNKISVDQKIAGFGIHSYIFPYRDLMDTFSLRFAQDVLEQMIKIPSAEDINIKADEVLDSNDFTRMANEKTLESLPTDPPNSPASMLRYIQLRGNIKVGSGYPGQDKHWPHDTKHHVRNLDKRVQRRQTLLVGHKYSQSEIIDQCERLTGAYIGVDPNFINVELLSVSTWVDSQKYTIVKIFDAKLADLGKNIFYQGGDPDTPYTLDIKPNGIRELMEALMRIEAQVTLLRDRLTENYEEHAGRNKALKEATDALAKAKQDYLDNLITTDEYIEAHQRYLEMQAWKVLMEGAIQTANQLLDKIRILWERVGDPAAGWVSYIQLLIDKIDDQLTEKSNGRNEAAELSTRTYFPKVSGGAEDALYKGVVRDRGLYSSLLRKMSWVFAVADSGGKEQTLESYALLLLWPPGDGDEKPSGDVFRQVTLRGDTLGSLCRLESRQMQARILEMDDPVEYGKRNIKETLEAMDIWDGLAYDFVHEWKPLNPTIPKAGTEYCKRLLNNISEYSYPYLGTVSSGKATAKVVTETGYVSHFVQVASPSSPREELASIIASKLPKDKADRPEFKRELVMYRINFKQQITDWSDYRSTLDDYIKAVEKTPNVPIHLFSNERNACILEGVIRDEELSKGDAEFSRHLNYQVVWLLGSLEAFESFSLALALGILDENYRETQKGAKKDKYKLWRVTQGKRKAYKSIGECWDLFTVIKGFTSGEYVEAREEIENAVVEKVEGLLERNKRDKKKTVLAVLKSASNIDFEPPPKGESLETGFENDLKLAMKAACSLWLSDAGY